MSALSEKHSAGPRKESGGPSPLQEVDDSQGETQKAAVISAVGFDGP